MEGFKDHSLAISIHNLQDNGEGQVVYILYRKAVDRLAFSRAICLDETTGAKRKLGKKNPCSKHWQSSFGQ